MPFSLERKQRVKMYPPDCKAIIFCCVIIRSHRHFVHQTCTKFFFPSVESSISVAGLTWTPKPLAMNSHGIPILPSDIGMWKNAAPDYLCWNILRFYVYPSSKHTASFTTLLQHVINTSIFIYGIVRITDLDKLKLVKLSYAGLVLALIQFLLLSQLPQKMTLGS